MLDAVFQILLNKWAIDDEISDFKLVRGHTMAQYTSVQLYALPTDTENITLYTVHCTFATSLVTHH